MSSDDTIEYKDMGLRSFLEALAASENVRARVGVLGPKTQRSGGGLNNATIGARHEYGIGVPTRSFLRMPLIDHLQGAIDNSGAFTQEAAIKVVNEGTVKPWVAKIGILAEGVVITAFSNEGYGKWPPLNPKYMEKKKVKQILVETRQLLGAITSDVK